MANIDVKYSLALELVNEILKTIKKPTVNTLEEFKDIDRELLITPQILQVITNYEPKFFGPFNKKKLRYYHKDIVKTYTLCFLRAMALDIGYKFTYTQKKVQKDTISKMHLLYYFQKNI